jgi:hypothetical protein
VNLQHRRTEGKPWMVPDLGQEASIERGDAASAIPHCVG